MERQRAEAEKRRRQAAFAAALAKAREALYSQRLHEASDSAEALCAAYPEEPAASEFLSEVREYLAAQRRLEAINQATQSARALMKEKRLDDAREVLEAGLRAYPRDTGICRLMEIVNTLAAAQERARKIGQVVRRAHSLADDGHLDEALRMVMDAIAEFGEETSLAECKRNFQRERHQRDYARGLQAQLEQGRRLLTEGNSAGAVRLLDDAMLQYPGEPEISLLLTSARGAFRDSEFLKQHRSQIAGLEAVGQYGAALALMEAALARYPGNTELLDTAARLRQGLQEQERKRLFAAHVSRVEEAIKSGDWDAAATRCEGAQRDFPEEAALAELFETVSRTRRETEERARLVAEERARRESEELARRQEESAIAKGRNDADALVRKGDYQGAVATLDRLASQHPGHPDIQRDREAAQGELERQRWQAEEQARLKLTEDRTSIPPWVRIDNVHFTLTGPSVLPSNFSFEINFWAHVERQRQKIIEYAKEAARVGNSDLAVKTEGPFPLQRGARISVRLKVDGLNCRDNHKWLTWTGEIGRAIFVFEVPRDAIEGTHAGSASIRLNGCQIARMSFVLYVGKPRFDNTVLESHLTSHRRGFASYASDDRSDVLARVQGMEVAYKGLKVFVDVIDLRSGQYWETEIARRIAEADVFYLFWCRHAILSEWVSKEWHLALNLKGLDFIDPVPLEGPEHATPPRELAGKHFNDPLLGFIAAAGGGTHA